MRLRILLAGSAAGMAMALTAAAETLYVQLDVAQIRSGRGPLSKVVGEVKFNDKVEAERQDAKDGSVWYLVSQTPAGPTKGYLSGATLLAEKAHATGLSKSKGADSAQATAALKGLDDWDKLHAKNRTRAGVDYAALEWMEQKSGVKADALRAPTGFWAKFRAEGKLGEFGLWGSSEGQK